MQQFLHTALCFIINSTKLTDWLIFCATAAYAVIAAFQWRAIRDQANIGSTALLLTQRPQLKVRNIVVNLSDTTQIGAAIRGQFYVENVGGGIASITEIGCWVAHIQGNLPMKRMYEGLDPNNPSVLTATKDRQDRPQLRPGESGTVKMCPNPILEWKFTTAATPEPRRAQRLYVYGWIHYEDGLGIVRRCAFCREFDNALERFVPVDNPDYEHAP
jgi:hypothetical protein